MPRLTLVPLGLTPSMAPYGMAVAHKVDGLGFWVGLVDHEFVGWWTLFSPPHVHQPDDRGVADLGYRHVEGIEQGEVEYGMTREQWRFRRESPPREREGRPRSLRRVRLLFG